MARSLITFPIRLGLRGANMAVEGAATVAGHALGMAGRVAEVLTKDGGPDLDIDGREHEPEKPRERTPPAADKPRRERRPSPAPVRPAQAAAAETEPAQAAAAETEPAQAAAPDTAPAPAAQETPAHVSEEPTLVDEVAEAGAQDGAGAEVHVDEPWENYDELSAEDVIDRITGASTAELAAVQLYEQSHRRRKTVLEAVKRQLQRPSQ